VRGVLIYCTDYKCSHWIRISADNCPTMCGCPISKTGSPVASRAVADKEDQAAAA
jgi:hypothetical protein